MSNQTTGTKREERKTLKVRLPHHKWMKTEAAQKGMTLEDYSDALFEKLTRNPKKFLPSN